MTACPICRYVASQYVRLKYKAQKAHSKSALQKHYTQYLDVWDVSGEFIVNDFPGYGSVVLIVVLLEGHRVEFGANLSLPALYYVHINMQIYEYICEYKG